MRNNQRIFIFLFTFFIVVALGSLYFLGSKGSAFDKSRDSFGSATAVLSQMITGLKGSEKKEPKAEQAIVDTVVEKIIAEPKVEEEPVAEPEEAAKEPETYEVRYFTFVTDTQKDNLRMRTEPSESGQIITKLKKNTTGYVLKPGNKWCRVVTKGGSSGYCATQYLILTEVTKEDFPSEHQESVEAPEEELSEKFEN
jgi:uncharacterized protein YgiM (DUF1202 family)